MINKNLLMKFTYALETSIEVKEKNFLELKLFQPLKNSLLEKDFYLKEFLFNLRILSREFQNFFPDECRINKKSKRFIYTQEIDSGFFNKMTEDEALRYICAEINVALNKYDSIKPKTYQEDGFVKDVIQVIKEWL